MTAGNAPGVNDGAAALVVMAAERAKALGLAPLARIVGQATAGLAPRMVMMTPVEAVRKLAKKTGWNLVVGGSSARRPRVGDLIREKIPEEEVVPLVKRTLEYYRDNAKGRERVARFVDRVGIEDVKDALA